MDILRKLKCHDRISNPLDFQVKAYLDMSTKPLEQVVMKVDLEEKNCIHKSILLDDEFDIQFEFDHLNVITCNLTKLNHKMAFCKEKEGNQVKIQGILGEDILQYETSQNHQMHKRFCLADFK